MPRITARELTYGIEIECGIDRDAPVRIGGRRNGINCRSLPEFGGNCWKAEQDGSVSVSDRRSCEFVSPILNGAAGLDNIRATCAQIKAWGGRVNRTCGLHIHVAFPTDSVAAMRRLTMLVGQFEEALYASTGTPDRRDNHYCRPIKTDSNKSFEWNRYQNKNDLRGGRHADLSDRYRILNWTNFIDGRFPTVEFRVFSGSVNPAKIAAWVQIALTLVEMALDGVEAGGWDARVSNWSSFGASEGEQRVRHMCRRVWFGHGHREKNYGELGHATFTRKSAERTLKALAIRHDERLGRRNSQTRSTVRGVDISEE